MATLSGKDVQELRARGQQLDASLQMGKQGLNDAFIGEVRDQLDDQELIKVRLLRSARAQGSSKELAGELADAVGAVLIEVRGHTCLLYKP